MFQLLCLLLLMAHSQAFNLCSWHKPDFCLGVSGEAAVGVPLQLKSRFNSAQVSSNRTDWQTEDGFFLKMVWTTPPINSSQNATLSYFYMDKSAKGTRAVLSKRSDGAYLNGSRVVLNGTSDCLTLMKCNPSGGFCDPFSTQAVQLPTDIKKGAYMRFRPCRQEDTVSQTLELDPPCARNCTKEQLENMVCDPSCDTKECYYDNGYCNTTTPTQMPSQAPSQPTTTPTWMPTHSPTMGPLEYPSAKPSTAPSEVTVSPTTVTSSPSSHPSSGSPTPAPQTPQPTGAPVVVTNPPVPSLQPTLSPSAEVLPPPPPETPSPTHQTSSPSSVDAYGAVVGLSVALVFLWLLFVALFMLLWKRQEAVEQQLRDLQDVSPSVSSSPHPPEVVQLPPSDSGRRLDERQAFPLPERTQASRTLQEARV